MAVNQTCGGRAVKVDGNSELNSTTIGREIIGNDQDIALVDEESSERVATLEGEDVQDEDQDSLDDMTETIVG